MTFARSSLPRTAAAVLFCLIACGDDDATKKPERDAGDVRDASVSGTQFGMDFNPVAGGATGLSGAAYTNSYGGATASTLNLLDASANSLCTSTNPNGGSVANCVPITVGSEPLDVTAASEIDIAADVHRGHYCTLRTRLTQLGSGLRSATFVRRS